MLRILILACSVSSFSLMAETPKYKEPEKAVIKEQEAVITEAMKQADVIMKDGTLDKVLAEERGKLNRLPSTVDGLNVELPKFLDKERDDRYLAKALAAGKSIDDANASPMEAKYPIVLISLSMPESQIKELIAEAYQIGAAIAVRGLIDDDFQKTLVKLKQLAGEKDGGVLIDPTLFRRFDVTAVPTFIMPLEPLKQCSDKECPTPKYVKATGSATFRYFLDLVSRVGNEDEKQEATAWLSKYGD